MHRFDERQAGLMAYDETAYITNVRDVTYPDGSVGPCYALVTWLAAGIAITVKQALDLQRNKGYEFKQPHVVYPGDFDTWFAPDFPQIGNRPTGELALI